MIEFGRQLEALRPGLSFHPTDNRCTQKEASSAPGSVELVEQVLAGGVKLCVGVLVDDEFGEWLRV